MTGLRQRKKQATCAAILKAAEELMVAQGFAATTMEQVARAADVSVGSLYNYFANKNALLIGIMSEATSDILAQGQPVLDEPGDDARAAIFRLMHIYVELVEHFDKELLKETFAIAFTEPPEVLADIAGLDMMLAEQLGQLVADLQRRGLITDEVSVQDATMALYGTMAVALMMWLGFPDTDHELLLASLDRQLSVVFHGLDPHPP